MEFDEHYWAKRTRSNYVIQKDVIHKGKTFQFRADSELKKYIEDLAKELNQAESKVIKDILDDFFLENKIRQQKEDLENL